MGSAKHCMPRTSKVFLATARLDNRPPISAGDPGSRANAKAVGHAIAGALCRKVCNSRSARFAAHTSVGRSFNTQ